MPTITRKDVSAPAARTTSTNPALPAAPAAPVSAPKAAAAWTPAPAAGAAAQDGFAGGPTGTARWLPPRVSLNEAQLAAATEKYGPAAGERLKAWGELLEQVKGLPEREKVQRVHDFLTFSAMYASDAQHFGKSDHWATPTELLGSGAGDCEDFALIRYASLRQVGIPQDQLQLAYVKARTGEAHMVLMYRDPSGGEPWVMDNLETDMLRTPGRRDLTPVFGFNEQHLWVTRTLGDTSTPAGSPARLSAFQNWLQRVGAGE